MFLDRAAYTCPVLLYFCTLARRLCVSVVKTAHRCTPAPRHICVSIVSICVHCSLWTLLTCLTREEWACHSKALPLYHILLVDLPFIFFWWLFMIIYQQTNTKPCCHYTASYPLFRTIYRVFFNWYPLKVLSTKKVNLGYTRLGVSRSIYVKVDSPNLGFPYFNFLGGYQWKKHPVYLLLVMAL